MFMYNHFLNFIVPWDVPNTNNYPSNETVWIYFKFYLSDLYIQKSQNTEKLSGVVSLLTLTCVQNFKMATTLWLCNWNEVIIFLLLSFMYKKKKPKQNKNKNKKPKNQKNKQTNKQTKQNKTKTKKHHIRIRG